jgi:hypothetical protein
MVIVEFVVGDVSRPGVVKAESRLGIITTSEEASTSLSRR